jgi:hypothetical protein
VLVGERAEHNASHGAEDRGRRADTESERDDGNGGEGGGLKQLADRERGVLPQLAEEFGASHGSLPVGADRSAFGAHVVEIAEAAERFRARLGRVHAALDELARAHLDVKLDLGGHLLGDRRPPDEAQEPAGAAL